MALLDQAGQTATDLQALKAPAQALEAKVTLVRETFAKLSTEEMSVRVKLAQRFNREFPPLATYTAITKPGIDVTRPSDAQIMQSLIGKSIGGPFDPWTFESPQEFVTFQVTTRTNRSDVLMECEIQTHVKGARTGNEHDFRLRLTLGKLYTRWKVVTIQRLQ